MDKRKAGRAALVVGLAGLLVAGGFYVRVAYQMGAWERARAEVVDIRTTHRAGDYRHHPIFRFTDASGAAHLYESPLGANPPAWDKGDSVHVYYDPDNPADVLVDTFWQKYLLVVIAGSVGVVGLGAGLKLSGDTSRA